MRVAAAIYLACLSSTVLGDTAAEMLEKGIYNEETVGNLDAAIEIYRKVVTSANETERVAANAQYRLGQCLLKQNKKSAAMKAFQAVVDSYPNQKEFVAKAQKHLPSALELLPAPWKSGERLTLEMRLPGGQPIGVIGAGIESGEMRGKPVWKMAIRRFVGGSQNSGVSMVAVDKATNRPLVTKWDHTLLGKADGKWSSNKVEISIAKNVNDEPKKETVEFTQPAYSNDQWFYGFRQLPIKVGYKVTLPIRVAFTGGNPIDMEVEVKKKEKISSPAGEFDCFRLDTNINQTFWISDTPERYLVKFDAGDVEAYLINISTSKEPVRLQHADPKCSVQVPAGWFYFEPDPSDEREAKYVLVSPQMGYAVVSIEERDPSDERTAEDWIDRKISRGKRSHKNFAVREDSRKAIEIAGQQGVTFRADHDVRQVPFTTEVCFTQNEDLEVAISAEMRKGTYKKFSKSLNSLRESISLK